MADAPAALRALAKHHGVQRAWRAWDGSRRVVSDDVLLAVLAAMGVEIARVDDAPEALRLSRDDQLRQMLEPVVVLWDGAPLRLTVRVPSGEANNEFRLRIELEDGEAHEFGRRDCRVGAPRRDGMAHVSMLVEPPVRIPPGVHAAAVSRVGHDDSVATVIAAPSHLRDRSPGVQRRWGVFAPLYALHDEAREIGDLGALERLAVWAEHCSADVIATLPLLAAFVGAGREPTTLSPYSPVSRRYWNETYLDVAAVPELAGVPRVDGDRSASIVDIVGVAARRRHELQRAYDTLHTHPSRADAFAHWCAAHPDAVHYARFRSAVEQHGSAARIAEVGAEDPTARYHAYVQWLAVDQLDALHAELTRRRQVLYLDLPLGTHRDGFDVHAHPDLFVLNARVGAPPDEFNRAGQDWGTPPVNPAAARRTGHAELIAALRTHLSACGILRVDHVMGLQRLWWLPGDAGAADGAYVQYPSEELYALLCLEAERAGALIVGENLGTVPHETSRALQAHRMLGMYVAQFELRDDGLAPPGRRTLAAIDTHDTRTFARWWAELEPIDQTKVLNSLRDARVLDEDGGDSLEPSEVLGALLAFLGTSRAEMVLVALEDLWLEPEQQNDPSAPEDRRAENFAHRAARSFDEVESDESIRALLARLDAARRRGLVEV